MDRLNRPELLEEIARRDELIEQLQNELRALRLYQVQAEQTEREMASRLARLERQEEQPMSNGGALVPIVNGSSGSHLSAPPLLSNRHQPLCAQFSADSQQQFTHARKIAVSAESSRYLHREQQQMEQQKQREREKAAGGDSNSSRRWSKQLSRDKDQHTLETLRQAILSNEFMCQMESDEIGAMIQGMRPMDVPAETTIVRQGELSSELFVLQEGRVQVSKDQRFIRVMEGPCVFGELAILYHCERTATVIALTQCRLWALHRTAFHTIMVTHAKSRQQQNFNHLKRCAQLAELLDDGQLLALAGQVREEFWQFRTELDQKQLQGRIYLITKGRITLRRRPQSDSPPELLVLSVGAAIGIQQLYDAVAGGGSPRTAAAGNGTPPAGKRNSPPCIGPPMGQQPPATATSTTTGFAAASNRRASARSDSGSIGSNDELIEQLQNELRALRLYQVQAEQTEREMASRLARLERQEEQPMSNGGALVPIVNGSSGSHLSAPPLLSNRHQPLCAQFSADSQQQFTHARKIAVSAESSRYLHREQQQMEQQKQREREKAAGGDSNSSRRWSKQLSRDKDQHTLETLRQAILSNEFMCQMESDEIGAMIQGMRPMDVPAETTIVRQGELSSELFVLQEGRVQVSKDQRFIRVMEGPCVFGELAILYHCERTATVIALTQCRLWALHRTAFHTIMVTHAKSRQQQNFNHLKRCAQLAELLDDGQLLALAGQVREEFWQFRTELDQKQLQGRIYLITKGRITLRRRPQSDSPPELLVLSVGAAIGIQQLYDAVAGGGSPRTAAAGNGTPPAGKRNSPPCIGPPMGQQPPATATSTTTGFAAASNRRASARSDSGSIGSRHSSLSSSTTTTTATEANNNSSSSSTPSSAHYFVDSVEGCTLLAMLVEQVTAKLPASLMAGHADGGLLLEADQENDDHRPEAAAAGEEDGSGKCFGRQSGTALRPGTATDDGQGSSVSGDDRSEDNVGVDDEFEELELPELKTVATLGVGGFGRVNLVRQFDSERVYALKILNKRHVKDMNQIEHVQNERAILLDCRCDFIVRLYKTFRDSERLYMLMEYCPGGEVWTMLRNWGRFDETTARYYCAAALEAFDYLHRRLIIYRDLKPENMLLDINGIPKLVDFGFAKQLPSEGARAWTFCGTAEYVAPEVILNKGQDTAVDLWSLGIFMFELISGSPPFASTDPMHTYNSILKGVQLLAWPRFMSDNARSLICKFCRRDPSQRLGYGRIEDARQDPWFRGFDFVSFRNHTMRPPIRPKVRSLTDTQNFDRYPSTDNFACGSDDSGWDEDF